MLSSARLRFGNWPPNTWAVPAALLARALATHQHALLLSQRTFNFNMILVPQEPYRMLARRGFDELLCSPAAGGARVLPVIPQLVMPLRGSLTSGSPEVIQVGPALGCHTIHAVRCSMVLCLKTPGTAERTRRRSCQTAGASGCTPETCWQDCRPARMKPARLYNSPDIVTLLCRCPAGRPAGAGAAGGVLPRGRRRAEALLPPAAAAHRQVGAA